MIDQNKNPKASESKEDEIDADITHGKKEDLVDGIKTGKEKQKFYHDKPSDEQMYDSLDDREFPEDEESD